MQPDNNPNMYGRVTGRPGLSFTVGHRNEEASQLQDPPCRRAPQQRGRWGEGQEGRRARRRGRRIHTTQIAVLTQAPLPSTTTPRALQPAAPSHFFPYPRHESPSTPSPTPKTITPRPAPKAILFPPPRTPLLPRPTPKGIRPHTRLGGHSLSP